jgi:histidinol-phosphate/aromatic aminotransferase/cobyric acid decarboxylase-like protein
MNNSQPVILQYTTIQDPLPDFIYEGLKEFSKNANSYRPQPEVLIEKLAKKHNLPKEMIYLTAGIDEALDMFILAYGKTTYIFTPTYTAYKGVEEFGFKLKQIYALKNNSYQIVTDKIAEAGLIILANPNNPAGYTKKEEVITLVKNNPQAIVIIDEAYFSFAPELTIIDEIKNYKNLAVLRSFSKDYGMAGNRIAYMIAHPMVIAKVKNKTQWSNVSYLSVGAATIALDHEDYFANL